MTKFQAVFVLWLRHKNYCGCSWRALDGNYYARYTREGYLIPLKDKIPYKGYGGNQIEGLILEEQAFKILQPHPFYKEPYDLYECDITELDINFKNK